MSRTTLECHLKIAIYTESRGRLGLGKLDALKNAGAVISPPVMIVSEASPGFRLLLPASQKWRVNTAKIRGLFWVLPNVLFILNTADTSSFLSSLEGSVPARKIYRFPAIPRYGLRSRHY